MSKIESNLLVYLIKKSAFCLESDLKEFKEEIIKFSDEQILAIVSSLDNFENQKKLFNKELTKRVSRNIT